MIPQPTELPEWATQDVQDPISGQYNVVTPPTEVKLEGWRLGEKPNRQWWNWFNRTVYDWINYFNANLDFTVNTFVPVWQNLDLGSILTNDGKYSIVGDKCYFTIHLDFTGNTATGPFKLTNLPFTVDAGFLQSIHCSRGTRVTLPGQGVISGLVNPLTTVMDVWIEDLTAGQGQVVPNAGTGGQYIFSGFYFIEPV